MAEKVRVKTKFNGVARRFEVDSSISWEELESEIRQLFDVEDFILKYFDDENELVTLGTHGEMDEALKVTQKTGLLRLVVQDPLNQGLTARIESFEDLLEEPLTQAPKRKAQVNFTAQMEANSVIKTRRMDSTSTCQQGSHSPSHSPPKEPVSVAVQTSQVGTDCFDVADICSRTEAQDDVTIPLLEKSVIARVDNASKPKGRYIRLADLMSSSDQFGQALLAAPVFNNESVHLPDTSHDCSRQELCKSPKGKKTDNCHVQLVESMAGELAAFNSLNPSPGAQLEDTYVFVDQQATLNEKEDPAKDINDGGSPVLFAGPEEEDKEEFLFDGDLSSSDLHVSPSTLDSQPFSASNNLDPLLVEEAVHRVVQKTFPHLVEETVRNLQGLHIHSPPASTSSVSTASPKISPDSGVVHKGIVCASCDNTIVGIRYKCCFCADYDLCEDCECQVGIHDTSHFFAKLRSYVPGIGRKNGEMVPILKKFAYKAVLNVETGGRKKKEEWKEGKKKEKVERKEKNREWKLIAKEIKKEEKEKRELKKKTRMEMKQLRHERDKATTVERLQNTLQAQFVADASVPDGSVMKAGQKFLKQWVVKNMGRSWNAKTVLQCIEGNIPLATTGQSKVNVPGLASDKTGLLAVEFVAPDVPGHYESKWQLCHHRIPFGPLFWCQIVVEEGKVECEIAFAQTSLVKSEPAQKAVHDSTSLMNSAFQECDTPPVVRLVDDIVSHSLVPEEPDEVSGSDAYLSSEDTSEFERIERAAAIEPMGSVLLTSNDTVAAAELEWDAGAVGDAACCNKTETEEENQCCPGYLNSDVESVDSDRSDEFMVVPVPPCFDPEAPLTADPAHVTVSVTEYKQMSESFHGSFLSMIKDKSTSEADSNSAVSIETTMTTDEGPRTVGASDVPPEMLAHSSEPVNPRPVSVEIEGSPVTVVSCHGEADPPITVEPLPVPEPVCQVDERDDDDGDGNDDDDGDNDDGDEREEDDLSGYNDDNSNETDSGADRQVSEVSYRPIATQPISGSNQPSPVALQPEPSSGVVVEPQTVSADQPLGLGQQCRNNSGDFASNVVSDVLSTAIDAVASASRAAIATVENLFHGGLRPQPVATYNPEQGCEIAVNTPEQAESTEENASQDAPPYIVVTWPPGRSPSTCHECLIEMGFCDRRLNDRLLRKHSNNIALVVNELLTLTDNNWSGSRH